MDHVYCIPFARVFQTLPDPRDPRGCRYAWWFLLTVIASGLLQGERSARGIAQWAAYHGREFRAYLGLSYKRMPSASTLGRTLRGLDVDVLEHEVASYAQRIDQASAQGIEDPLLQRGLAVDGKELRTASAYDEPVALLSCVRHGSGLTLGQQAILADQGEVTVAYDLLAEQDLAGQIVTLDAGLRSRKLLQQIIDQGGDYLLVVKQNCPTLYADIADLFAEEQWLVDRDRYEHTERSHGRTETRLITCSTDLGGYLRWPGVQQVIRRIRISVQAKTNAVSEHITYAITSLGPGDARAQALAQLWRGHWTIESKVHYVRDVTLGEDRCRIHTGSAPEALAALRNGLLALLYTQGWALIPDAIRYYRCSLQDTLHALGF